MIDHSFDLGVLSIRLVTHISRSSEGWVPTLPREAFLEKHFISLLLDDVFLQEAYEIHWASARRVLPWQRDFKDGMSFTIR